MANRTGASRTRASAETKLGIRAPDLTIGQPSVESGRHRHRAGTAASRAVELVHTFGSLSITPIGTNHGRRVNAPTPTMAIAIGRRTDSGSGMTWIRAVSPAFAARSSNHSIQSDG